MDRFRAVHRSALIESRARIFEILPLRYPTLAPHLDHGYAIAIDGEFFQDAWFAPIRPDCEVHLVPAIRDG